MMLKARQYHIRWGALLVIIPIIVLAVGFAVFSGYESHHLVEGLQKADITEVQAFVEKLGWWYRIWANPRLQKAYDDADASRKLRISLALLPDCTF